MTLASSKYDTHFKRTTLPPPPRPIAGINSQKRIERGARVALWAGKAEPSRASFRLLPSLRTHQQQRAGVRRPGIYID